MSMVKRAARGCVPAWHVLAVLIAVTLAACSQLPEGVTAMSAETLAERVRTGQAPVVLDVRSEEEFRAGHIPGAIHIPYDEVESRMSEIPSDKAEEVVVYCRSGRRAGIAEEMLVAAGFTRVRDLTGHMLGWSAASLPETTAGDTPGQ